MNWYHYVYIFFQDNKNEYTYIDYCQLHKGTNPRLKALTLAIVSSCNEYHTDIIIFTHSHLHIFGP